MQYEIWNITGYHPGQPLFDWCVAAAEALKRIGVLRPDSIHIDMRPDSYGRLNNVREFLNEVIDQLPTAQAAEVKDRASKSARADYANYKSAGRLVDESRKIPASEARGEVDELSSMARDLVMRELAGRPKYARELLWGKIVLAGLMTEGYVTREQVAGLKTDGNPLTMMEKLSDFLYDTLEDKTPKVFGRTAQAESPRGYGLAGKKRIRKIVLLRNLRKRRLCCGYYLIRNR